jgi:hypothetical protein
MNADGGKRKKGFLLPYPVDLPAKAFGELALNAVSTGRKMGRKSLANRLSRDNLKTCPRRPNTMSQLQSLRDAA